MIQFSPYNLLWRPVARPTVRIMRLYCGNLPPGTLPEELRALLSSFGRVDAVSIIGADEPDREHRFAFVVMPNAKEAERAIAALNGSVLQGFVLALSEARPRGPSETKRPRNRRGRSDT